MQYYQKVIKELREDNDYTQQKVADYLNIKQVQYWKYETGKQALPIRHLKELCILYGVSADYILGLPQGLSWPR